jgi:hypothetical protein
LHRETKTNINFLILIFMEKIKLTTEQFVNFIANLKGCQFVNVIALTDADMNKRNNEFYGRVKKFTITPMQINFDYEKAVNNRLKKEGKEPNFSAEGRKWGQWLHFNKVATHNGEYYLRCYCVKNSRPRTYYLLDGRIATEEEFAEFSQFFRLMLDPKNLPIICHCTAGKDRTGFATAALLSLLGVDRATIIEEYSLTEVAAILNISIPSVHKHKEKILKFIKENFKRG